jgi:PAS domain S-box-containing protein
MRYSLEANGEILRTANNLNLALDNIDALLHQIQINAVSIDQSSSEMKLTSEEMAGNTGEIANSIAEMSKGTQVQVQRVDDASNLIENILSSCHTMVERSKSINEAAKLGNQHSESGMKNIGEMVLSMKDISEYSNKAHDSISVLTERSREIERVLAVISDIAKQTNLLALNAAIEAAQAGDSGRGFAVVAEEIRKLAEDSKKSATEIAQLVQSVKSDTNDAEKVISSMTVSVRNGEQTTNHAMEAFKIIKTSSENTLNMSEDIVTTSKGQIKDISDVVNIIQGVVVIAEQNAAGTEEIAASASELATGMDGYNGKAHSLAKIAESLREGLSMVKLSGNASENSAIFKMREAFEKEKYLLDAMLNNSPDFIYFKDAKSRFIRNSMSHIVRFGCKKQEELLGKSDFDFQGAHAQEAFNDEQEIIRTGIPIKNRVQKADLKDGSFKYMSTTKMPLYDLDNNIVGTFGISRDITESKLNEIRIEEESKKFQQKEQDLVTKLSKLEEEISLCQGKKSA